MVTSKKVQWSEVGNRRREVMEEKGCYFAIPVNDSPKMEVQLPTNGLMTQAESWSQGLEPT